MTAPEAMMPDPAAHSSMPSPPPPEGTDQLAVQTRFGVIACAPTALIDMPQGPLGFARHHEFALLELPNPRLARFRLLQSLADPAVSFVVLPASRDGGLIGATDLDEACAAAGIDPTDLLLLMIVTVRPAPVGAAMTVNLRAPVLLEVGRRIARQVVLANAAYAIQHPL